MIRYDILPTRCGDLLVAINESGLVHVDFVAGLRGTARYEWLATRARGAGPLPRRI